MNDTERSSIATIRVNIEILVLFKQIKGPLGLMINFIEIEILLVKQTKLTKISFNLNFPVLVQTNTQYMLSLLSRC